VEGFNASLTGVESRERWRVKSARVVRLVELCNSCGRLVVVGSGGVRFPVISGSHAVRWTSPVSSHASESSFPL
jgi:hypothetical protein